MSLTEEQGKLMTELHETFQKNEVESRDKRIKADIERNGLASMSYLQQEMMFTNLLKITRILKP
jgi:hypothetical protein